jgi:hypothetical protein
VGSLEARTSALRTARSRASAALACPARDRGVPVSATALAADRNSPVRALGGIRFVLRSAQVCRRAWPAWAIRGMTRRRVPWAGRCRGCRRAPTLTGLETAGACVETRRSSWGNVADNEGLLRVHGVRQGRDGTCPVHVEGCPDGPRNRRGTAGPSLYPGPGPVPWSRADGSPLGRRACPTTGHAGGRRGNRVGAAWETSRITAGAAVPARRRG